MNTKGRKPLVRARIAELARILVEPHTVEQLADITGWSRKNVYKDLGKVAKAGHRLGSKLGIYWIEVPAEK